LKHLDWSPEAARCLLGAMKGVAGESDRGNNRATT
jgi:hypothetical protein